MKRNIMDLIVSIFWLFVGNIWLGGFNLEDSNFPFLIVAILSYFIFGIKLKEYINGE